MNPRHHLAGNFEQAAQAFLLWDKAHVDWATGDAARAATAQDCREQPLYLADAGAMSRPRAADDFELIRRRLVEIHREQNQCTFDESGGGGCAKNPYGRVLHSESWVEGGNCEWCGQARGASGFTC